MTQSVAPEDFQQAPDQAGRGGGLLAQVLDQIRTDATTPRVMEAVLDTVMRAVGGTGAAVLDLGQPPETTTTLHQAGEGLERALAELLPLLRAQVGGRASQAVGRAVRGLSCPVSTRFGHRAAVTVWRNAARAGWTGEDEALLGSVGGLVRLMLEHEAIQRELARQARTDPLTGLLNRRAFMEEAKRRVERLERERVPGTLMFFDLDRLKALNECAGYATGDAALVHTTAILRRLVRPADLVGRVGGDEFALWLDGFDDLSAAERAEHLRLTFPGEMAKLTEAHGFTLNLSVGIACRQPGSGEELEDVVARADQAMDEVKRNGRGHWRVSHPERVQ